ncbi:hypothetical protein EDC40_102485 [Aminobacter aminovorans]|uniref:Uncharacterized protein n=1 Tax=Aminobacter aminovorans TaxID=83263 RepID=A0A380WL67_AMIAI|nr:hypothetical protein EDC40_102485 [Aminobacter aminovorans]SUU88894.1 Uncharacterised protein [Aminobacter aminovorans]
MQAAPLGLATLGSSPQRDEEAEPEKPQRCCSGFLAPLGRGVEA